MFATTEVLELITSQFSGKLRERRRNEGFLRIKSFRSGDSQHPRVDARKFKTGIGVSRFVQPGGVIHQGIRYALKFYAAFLCHDRAPSNFCDKRTRTVEDNSKESQRWPAILADCPRRLEIARITPSRNRSPSGHGRRSHQDGGRKKI